jgi:hypothetical protein
MPSAGSRKSACHWRETRLYEERAGESPTHSRRPLTFHQYDDRILAQIIEGKWCARWDSNPQHPAWKSLEYFYQNLLGVSAKHGKISKLWQVLINYLLLLHHLQAGFLLPFVTIRSATASRSWFSRRPQESNPRNPRYPYFLEPTELSPAEPNNLDRSIGLH